MSNSAATLTTRPLAAVPTVSLLDLDPEFGSFLTDEERDAVASIGLVTRTFRNDGTALRTAFAEAEAFGAFVVEGILIHEVRLGDRTGMSLLGPGDVLGYPNGSDTYILGDTRWLPAGSVQLAMFNNRLLLALRRWPRLMVGLYMRLGQQLDRLTAQLLICQLPRVEDRVLGMMWLMAESWGKVTPAGTRLPVHMTHETIGMMIGARRPTVSLALRELAERGAMVRQGSGWLLLKPLIAEPSSGPAEDGPGQTRAQVIAGPELSNLGVRFTRTDSDGDLAASGAALRDAVVRLRNQHLRNVDRFQKRMADIRASRMECQKTRELVARWRVRELRQPPS